MKNVRSRILAICAISTAVLIGPLAGLIAPSIAAASTNDDTLFMGAFPNPIAGSTNNYVALFDATSDLNFGAPQGTLSIDDTTQGTVLCSSSTFIDAGSDSHGGENYHASCVSPGSELAGDQVLAVYTGAGQNDYSSVTSSAQIVSAPDTAITNLPTNAAVGSTFAPQFSQNPIDPNVESVTPQVCTVDPSGVVHNVGVGTCTLRAVEEGPISIGTFSNPTGIATDPFGDLYIADQGTGSQNNGNFDGGIYQLNDVFNGLIPNISNWTNFNPSLVASDSSGDVFVHDEYNGTIAGSPLQMYRDATQPPLFDPSIQGVTAMAADSNGDLFIAGPTGGLAEFLRQGLNYQLNNIGYSGNPAAMVVDSAGDIYIADGTAHNIEKLTPSGASYASSTVYSDAGFSPSAMAIDSSNTLYTVATNGTSVMQITPNQGGQASVSYVGNGLSNAQGVAVDPSGAIWLIEGSSGSSAPSLGLILPGALQSYTVSGPSSASMTLDYSIPASGDTVAVPVNGDIGSLTVTCGGQGVWDVYARTCTYPAAANAYQVSLSISVSTITGVGFGYCGALSGASDLTDVSAWSGDWTSFSCAFIDASQLTSVPSSLPSSTKDLSGMFAYATSFNQNIDTWDTTNVTSMSGMFFGASAFNNGGVDLASTPGGWNTTNVTSMSGMFNSDAVFDQDISSWDTSNVQDMSYMFTNDTDFNNGNAPLVSSPGKWNTSRVTSMSFMFQSATNFNQDISSWDFGQVSYMYFFAPSSGLSSTNYGLFLESLANELQNQGLQPSVYLDVTAQYPYSASTARSQLISYGWTIADGGESTSVVMPNLIGLSTTAALSALTGAGFTSTPVETPVTVGATSANNGQVLSQTVLIGTVESDPATAVGFSYYHYVAPVIAPTYVVPNLVGLTVSNAMSALGKAGFTVSPTELVITAGATASNDGLVATQSLTAGAIEKSPGVNISFSYYSYVPPLYTVPNLVGLTISAAQAALSAAGITSVPVATATNVGASSGNDGIIRSQSVAAGSLESDQSAPISLTYFKFAAPQHLTANCTFSTGSTTLSNSCKTALSNLVTAIVAGSVKVVSVVGYADTAETTKYGKSIALNRAAEVKLYLLKVLRSLHANVPRLVVTRSSVAANPTSASSRRVTVTS